MPKVISAVCSKIIFTIEFVLFIHCRIHFKVDFFRWNVSIIGCNAVDRRELLSWWLIRRRSHCDSTNGNPDWPAATRVEHIDFTITKRDDSSMVKIKTFRMTLIVKCDCKWKQIKNCEVSSVCFYFFTCGLNLSFVTNILLVP